MARNEKFNLFVYGTLMNPSVFRAVTGCRLVRRPAEADGVMRLLVRDATLEGYRKVRLDDGFHYAVPDRSGSVHGCLVSSLPKRLLPVLTEYEGQSYAIKSVQVRLSGREPGGARSSEQLKSAAVFVRNQERAGRLGCGDGLAKAKPAAAEIPISSAY